MRCGAGNTEEVLIAVRTATRRRAEQYIRQAKKRKVRNRIVAGLSVVVALATTYALMLPGITMERDAQCGVEAHQHTEACYTANLLCTQEEREATTVEHISLMCTFQPHEHTSECYNDEHELGCGQSTEYFHRHDEMCVDAEGNLICTLKEKIKRNHSASCYEEISTLVCETEETEGHQHIAECYTQVTAEEPTCGLEENEGHIHTEECNATVLTCTVEENAGHAHTEACKQTQRSLTCTEAEAEAHSHGEGCYENISELSCGKTEGEGAHSHGESCYITETALSCGTAEGEGAHTHGDGCYTEGSSLTCADETHEHDGNCYTTSRALTCSAQESAGHAHGEACYTHTQKLNCGSEESSGHAHGESCYTSRSQLSCTREETAGHSHGDECYTTSESIICGMEEGQGSHAHGADCYATSIACGVETGAGAHQHEASCYAVTEVLACGQEAGAGVHTHGADCYTVEKVRVCDHDELHKHESSCFVTDKQNKRWAICGYAELMEHQHTEACVTVETVTTEGHAHGTDCYETVLLCTQVEHTHTDECYPDSTEEPTSEPTAEPSAEPTATVEVTEKPTAEPSAEPMATVEVTEEPTVEPSAEPTATVEVTEEPTVEPSAEPTATVEVTEEPTVEPSAEPTATVEVTEEPTAEPSAEPTATVEVTEEPTVEPSAEPTATVEVTEEPTVEPSAEPTATPAPVQLDNSVLQPATQSDLEATVSYSCGMEEHIHDETCLDENWNIVCGLEYHAHTEDCSHACGLAAHTHSTSSVQGGIMLLDESDTGCYDAEGNLICTLEEHTHTEACAALAETGEEETETPTPFTLSKVVADVTYDSSADVFNLQFSANYAISPSVAKGYTRDNPLVLPLTGIDASQLVKESNEKNWQPDTNGNGMMYRFVQNTDGTYAMQIYYESEKLTGTEDIGGTIAFSATMNSDSRQEDGDYFISVGEETIEVSPEKIYGENPSVTQNYDMSVNKSGSAVLSANKLTYTITVSTTKGFPDVNISDVITIPEGLTLNGDPKIANVELKKQDANWTELSKTTITDAKLSVGENGSFTLDLPAVDLSGSEARGEYTITVEYPINELDMNVSVNDVSNTVTATAKDDKNESVTGSSTHTMSVTNNTVSKSGWFDSNTGKINWTITVNENNKDIAGGMVADKAFLEAMGLTEEKLAELEASATDGVLLDNNALQSYLNNNLAISPNANVSLVKQGEVYFLRFDGDENGTNTSKYTITYATDPEVSMVAGTEVNTYTFIYNDNTITGSQTVTVPAGGSVTKTNSVATTTDLSAIEIDWTSTIELPEGGIPAGQVIEDTLSDASMWENGQEIAVRWFTQEQMNALYSAVTSASWWNTSYSFNVKAVGSDVLMPFDSTANGQYYAWTINVNDVPLKPTEGGNTITLNYNSMFNAQKISSTSASSSNKIKVDEKEAWSTYTWSERVVKKDEGGNTSNSSKTVTATNNTITWVVEVYVDDDYEQIVVTDKVPSITVGDETVALELVQLKAGTWGDADFDYSGGTPAGRDHNNVQITPSAVSDGTVSVTLAPTTTGTWASKGNTMRLHFVYKLPDDIVNGYVSEEEVQNIAIGTFTNTVGVTVKKPNENSSAYGGDDQSQTVTLQVPALTVEDGAEFGKTGEYIDYQRADESDTGEVKEHVLEYTVDINKLAADLNASGDTITVVDVLTHNTAYSYQCTNCWKTVHMLITATLNSSSVKLYRAQRDADGALLTNEDGSLVKGLELAKSLWSMSYSEQVSNTNEPQWANTTHTLTLTVPDNEAYVLEYAYEVEIDRKNLVAKYCSCNSLSIPTELSLQDIFKNVLWYNNAQEGSHSTSSNDVWTASSSVVTMNVAMSIEKVDENNASILLDGAEFTLYVWDNTANAFVATDTLFTTTDGKFRIEQEKYKLQNDTAYYIVETKAPFGYKLPDDPEEIYFYFASGNENPNYIGPDGFVNDSSYHELSKGGEKLTITNEKQATSVNVTKTWSGEGEKPESVSVYLYRYALTEEQWEKLKEQGTEGDGDSSSETEYTVKIYTTMSKDSVEEYLTETKVKQGYSVKISIKPHDGKNLWELKINAGDIVYWQYQNDSSCYVYYTLGEINSDTSVLIYDYSNLLEEDYISYTKTPPDGNESTEEVTTSIIYTPATIAALEGKQQDSSFSRVLTLTGDSWSASVDDLDLLGKDAEGNTVHYVYFIEEGAVPGWESSVGGGGSDAGYNYTLNNTYDQSSITTTALSVTKAWQDAEGNALPEEQWQDVQIQLYRKVKGSTDAPTLYVYDKYDTFIINAENEWTKNFVELPCQVIKNGEVQVEYEYSVEEVTTGDFETNITYGDETAVIANKLMEDSAQIHVKKVWNGDTTSVKVYLRRYEQAVTATDENGGETLGEKIADTDFNADNAQYITLDGTTTTGSFTKLEKSATVDGTKYYYFYYVEEDADDAANYTVTYDNNDGAAGNTADAPIIITNTKNVTGVTVAKVWQNADGTAMTENLPGSVSFTLWQVAGENATQYPDAETSYTLNADNGWSMTLSDLPRVSATGETYTYQVQEAAVEGFVTSYTGNGVAQGDITITNKATRLTIGKTWMEADGQTPWTEHSNTVVYLQVSKDGAVLGKEALLKYVDASAVSADGCLMITGTSNVTLDKLPLGSYTVNEVGYSTDGGTTVTQLTSDTASEWKVSDSTGATLTETAHTGSITVTNTARTSLTVTKQWEGLAEGENPPYTVYLRVKDANGVAIDPTKYGVTADYIHTQDAENWLKFTKGSITLRDLLPGNYTVEEVAYLDGDTIVLLSGSTETPFTAGAAQNVTLGTAAAATVVNKAKQSVTGSLTVKKEWIRRGSGDVSFELHQVATPKTNVGEPAEYVDIDFVISYEGNVKNKVTKRFAKGSVVTWYPTWNFNGNWYPGFEGDANNAAVEYGSITYSWDGGSQSISGGAPVPDGQKVDYTINVGTVNNSGTVTWAVRGNFEGQSSWSGCTTEQDRFWAQGFKVDGTDTVVGTFSTSGGSKTFTNLLLEDDNYTYTYYVKEPNSDWVTSYTSTVVNGSEQITIHNMWIENSIKITKAWLDPEGQTMAAPTGYSIDFELYRVTKSANDEEIATLIDTYTLNSGNNWTITLNDVADQGKYHIKEVAVKDGSGTSKLSSYDVKYSYGSELTELNADGLWVTINGWWKADLYLVNQLRATYTLPETGGGGTQWYTGGGALLAGVALTLLYRGNKRKRRAEE